MNKENFNQLSEQDKNIVFEEMCELYNLISDYPIGLKELKTFTEWHMRTGKFGEDLKRLLIGICPSEELNSRLSKDEILNILTASNEVLKLVSTWNRIVFNEYKLKI